MKNVKIAVGFNPWIKMYSYYYYYYDDEHEKAFLDLLKKSAVYFLHLEKRLARERLNQPRLRMKEAAVEECFSFLLRHSQVKAASFDAVKKYLMFHWRSHQKQKGPKPQERCPSMSDEAIERLAYLLDASPSLLMYEKNKETIHHDYLKEIGGLIGEMRKLKRMSLDEFSVILGVSKTTLYAAENGKAEISITLLNRVALAFQIPLSLLISYGKESCDIAELQPFALSNKQREALRKLDIQYLRDKGGIDKKKEIIRRSQEILFSGKKESSRSLSDLSATFMAQSLDMLSPLGALSMTSIALSQTDAPLFDAKRKLEELMVVKLKEE